MSSASHFPCDAGVRAHGVGHRWPLGHSCSARRRGCVLLSAPRREGWKNFQVVEAQDDGPRRGSSLAVASRAGSLARAEWEISQKLPSILASRRSVVICASTPPTSCRSLECIGRADEFGWTTSNMSRTAGAIPGDRLFQMRPGLAGPWQVSARNACSFSERATYDNEYADVMSFAKDIRILLQTPFVVLRGTGL